MLDTIRQTGFFNPLEIEKPIHVIGVGAVGSHVANALARMGLTNIHLWDEDTVGSHNIPNQLFFQSDIGKPKTISMANTIKNINNDANVHLHPFYKNETLDGYVFVCVDSITVRKLIYENNEYNLKLDAVFDTRIGLDDGQVLSADWKKEEDIKQIIEMSNFKQEEVYVPVSACGTKLTVLPTVAQAATEAVANFINFIKTKELKKMIVFNSFNHRVKGF